MDKVKVDRLIPAAYQALKAHGIADEKGRIVKTYRGQISTFGAALNGGSLLAAIAFFSQKKDSTVDRPALLLCLRDLIGVPEEYKNKPLFDYVLTQRDRELECKNEILDAAIALKLAMNLYTLWDGKKEKGKEA